EAVSRDADDGFNRARDSTGISHLRIIGREWLVTLSVIELDLWRVETEAGYDTHIKDKPELAENRQKRIGRRCAPRSRTEGNTGVGWVNLAEQVLQVLFSGNQHCPNLLIWIVED